MAGYITGFGLLFLVWHLAAIYLVKSTLFPPPGPVLARGWMLIEDGILQEQIVASLRRIAQGFLLDAATIAWMFDHTLPYHHRHDWRFAPLNADVDGVAPACVILAECDPLVDEGLAYADRLRAAGVDVTLELTRGVTHDFIKMGRALKEAHAALDVAAAALKAALHPTEERQES